MHVSDERSDSVSKRWQQRFSPSLSLDGTSVFDTRNEVPAPLRPTFLSSSCSAHAVAQITLKLSPALPIFVLPPFSSLSTRPYALLLSDSLSPWTKVLTYFLNSGRMTVESQAGGTVKSNFG